MSRTEHQYISNHLSSRSRSLLLAVFLFICGCAPFTHQPILDMQETRVDIVLKAVKQNFQNLHSLDGYAQLLIESPRLAYQGQSKVLVKKPDSLYLKIEAMLGIDIGYLFADRSAFLVYSPYDDVSYYGSSRDSLRLDIFLGFNMTFDQCMQAMSGVTVPEQLENANITSTGDRLLLTGTQNDLSFTYQIDPAYAVVSRLEVRDATNRVVRLEEYSRFISSKGVRLPQTIRYTRPAQKESLTLFYNTLKINTSIDAHEFTVKVPDNTLKVRI